MPIRGGLAGAPNTVACFIETPGGGDWRDIDAPRNAPMKNPMNHLDKVIWHTDFFQYELVVGIMDITVNHAALAGRTRTQSVGGENVVQLNILGDVRTTDIALYSHGLGYEPKIMLAYGGRVLPSGYMIQNDGSGLNRTIAPWASSSTVYLREVAISSASTLGAVSRDYKLIVLRNAAPNPALPAMSGDGVDIQIGRGLIDSTKSYLRKVGVGDSPFSLDNDYGIDDNNGRLRTAAGGVVVTESGYGGSMVAPPFIQVGV